jgi:hypothetical protein
MAALTVYNLATGPFDNEIPNFDHLVAPYQHVLPDNGQVEGEYQAISMYESFIERNPSKRKHISFARYHEIVKSIRADFENAKKYRNLGGRKLESNAEYFLSNAFTKNVATGTRERVPSKKMPTASVHDPEDINTRLQFDEDTGDDTVMGQEIDLGCDTKTIDYLDRSSTNNVADRIKIPEDDAMTDKTDNGNEDGIWDEDLDLDKLEIPEGVPREEHITEIKQLHAVGMWNPAA